MKKRLWILILLVLVAAALPLAASAAIDSGKCGDNLTWTLDSSYVLTISGSGKMDSYSAVSGGTFYAPWSWGKRYEQIRQVNIKKGVTTIGNCAFDACQKLTDVTIPDGVTSIGYYAFHDCVSLKSITIPNSVTQIDWGAFNGCTSLKSITLPNRLTEIVKSTFYGCTNLTSITIPNSVKTIRESVFNGCTGLTGVTIPSSVTSIGSSAFSRCKNLKSVTIPNSVTDIGKDAFSSCSKDLAIQCHAGSYAHQYAAANRLNVKLFDAEYGGYWGSNLYWALDNSGVLTLFGKGEMENFYKNTTIRDNTSQIIIQQGITSIGSSAFDSYSSLTSVSIPKSVVKIGAWAFSDCKMLESVTIPDSVTSIGKSAFSRCKNLKSVTIPDSVTQMGEDVFKSCSSDLVIRCNTGSYAHEYANANSIKVKLLDAAEEPLPVPTEQPLPASTEQPVSVPVGQPLPVITVQPVSVNVTAGSTATFTVTANDAASYQWYCRPSEAEQWTPVDGAVSETYTFTAEESRNGWQFCCQVSNFYGSTNSDTVTLTVTAGHDTWDCPHCGRTGNKGNFCGTCGYPAPWMETP